MLEPFGDEDDKVDIPKIMEAIKKDIVKKDSNFDTKLEFDNRTRVKVERNLFEKDIKYINSIWNVQNNNYFITSHRPVIGKGLILGRELVNGELRRYIDPMILKQNEFNITAARLLTNTVKNLEDMTKVMNILEDKISHLTEIDDITNRLDILEDKISHLTEIDDITNRLDILEDKISHLTEIDDKIYEIAQKSFLDVVEAMNEDIENKAWLANILQRCFDASDHPNPHETVDLDINYFAFQDIFRGNRKSVKERQSVFVDYFEDCNNVLDIGCGRGEFLDLMRDAGVKARGIDINENMVDYCRSRGLDVDRAEAIVFLNMIDDKSLDGVFIDQVIEHLEPDYLVKMLGLCYDKLKYGYYIIIQTVNPLSFTSLANFYIDPTHKRPVHPKTLKFLLESAGFRDVVTKFYSPVDSQLRLKKIDILEDVRQEEIIHKDIFNRNIDMLNYTLYGAQDYSIIAKK